MPINLDEDFVAALLHKMKPGEHVKVVHPYKLNGEVCSIGSSPAMNVLRNTEGIKCYCHRCGENGTLTNKNLSPASTLELLKRIKDVRPRDEMDKIDLPSDCIPIKNGSYEWNDNVPIEARQWLWMNGLHVAAHVPMEWQWSNSYQRIIIPVFDGMLVGWVGRTVNKEAKDLCIPKYITRKQAGYDKRLLFEADFHLTTDKLRIIFCEDVISATKINATTACMGVALLTTHIDHATLKRYPNASFILWLDGDMNKKSMNKVKRLKALGWNITGIRTEKDPKHLFMDIIREEVDKAWAQIT